MWGFCLMSSLVEEDRIGSSSQSMATGAASLSWGQKSYATLAIRIVLTPWYLTHEVGRPLGHHLLPIRAEAKGTPCRSQRRHKKRGGEQPAIAYHISAVPQ